MSTCLQHVNIIAILLYYYYKANTDDDDIGFDEFREKIN